MIRPSINEWLRKKVNKSMLSSVIIIAVLIVAMILMPGWFFDLFLFVVSLGH